jgi:hypothetical protein
VAAEPINIFSHKQDLAGVATLVRQLAPGVKIIGPDDAWERLTIEGTKSWFRKAPVLSILHAAEYYRGADWPRQVAGMEGFFSGFPDVPRKSDVFRLIRTFRFALSTEFNPDLCLGSNDPRLKVLFAVAHHLDGVLFTPSGLWDAAGRPLLCADGRSDAQALLPDIPEMAPEIPAPAPAKVIPASAPAASQEPEKTAEPDKPAEPVEPELDEPESVSLDARRVARRALCLAAVAGRGLLEVEPMPPDQAEAQRKRILNWTSELALEDEFEPKELDLLQQAVGTATQQAAVDACWRLEGVGMLAWALGRYELPAYDQLVDAGELLPAVGFLNLNEATKLLASPVLRDAEELRKRQDQWFALHWRLRDFSLHKKSINFRTFARECWFGPLDSSGARFCHEDLAIGGVPIGKAPEEEFRKALSAANERHLAINWLADGGAIYSETDTAT